MAEQFPFIGQLNRKIQILKMNKTRNSTGEEEIVYSIIASPYAMMQDISGNEDIEGKVRHFINRHYTIRWSTIFVENVPTDLLVQDGASRFNIYHNIELGRKQFIKLLVREYE